jgi:hypothetical protein
MSEYPLPPGPPTPEDGEITTAIPGPVIPGEPPASSKSVTPTGGTHDTMAAAISASAPTAAITAMTFLVSFIVFLLTIRKNTIEYRHEVMKQPNREVMKLPVLSR